MKNKTKNPEANSETTHNTSSKLHELINHYFFGKEFLNILSPESLIYCLLDPRFKNLPFVEEKSIRAAHQLLIEKHSTLHEKPLEENEINEQHQKVLNLYGISIEPRGTARTTLDAYFREPPLDPMESPFDWWKTKKITYPALAKLAQKYLARPSTSVPCERLWSEAGLIVNDLRSSLDPDSVSMLTFIEHNARELEKIGKPFIWLSETQ